jgi:SAM-dependent methyltransferase
MDIVTYNRHAWDRQVHNGCRWTVPVGPEIIAQARAGKWSVVLTPTRSVPADWFGDLRGLAVLCLASGGGQQAPVLAAAGANVTLLDNSPAQLERDCLVAEREGLTIRAVQGDMANLSVFADNYFDLIFHPCSNCFAQYIRPVWREAFRVLKPGGTLLAGFCNPVYFLFDDALAKNRDLVVRYAIPYSDLTSMPEQERLTHTARSEPLMFGHTLEDQIGGQLDAGFVLIGMYEDSDPEHPLAKFLQAFMATRACKPAPQIEFAHRAVPTRPSCSG